MIVGVLISLAGVFLDVPENVPALLVAGTVAALLVAAAMTGARLTAGAGVALADGVGWAALSGAVGAPWALSVVLFTPVSACGWRSVHSCQYGDGGPRLVAAGSPRLSRPGGSTVGWVAKDATWTRVDGGPWRCRWDHDDGRSLASMIGAVRADPMLNR